MENYIDEEQQIRKYEHTLKDIWEEAENDLQELRREQERCKEAYQELLENIYKSDSGEESLAALDEQGRATYGEFINRLDEARLRCLIYADDHLSMVDVVLGDIRDICSSEERMEEIEKEVEETLQEKVDQFEELHEWFDTVHRNLSLEESEASDENITK